MAVFRGSNSRMHGFFSIHGAFISSTAASKNDEGDSEKQTIDGADLHGFLPVKKVGVRRDK
jgi:hypothetical protein